MPKTIVLLLLAVWAVAAHAEESFSQALSPQNFSAAGLNKLTPTELAKLDELIAARGKPYAATATAAAAAEPSPTPAREDAKSTSAKGPHAPSLLDRAKVILSPGTEIEYAATDSTLVGRFQGWSKGTIFTLANGQLWQVIEDGTFWSPVRENVKVRVQPGALGSFFLSIDDGGRPKVKHLAGMGAAPAR